jgi:heptosyltransferase-1
MTDNSTPPNPAPLSISRLNSIPLRISGNFNRILLIKPSAVGDVINTVPVLAKLRTRFPSAQIDWLLTPSIAEWIGHHPALSSVVPFERQELSHPWKGLSSIWQLATQLQRAEYDLVIDLQGQFRSAFFTLATGAPVRIGFDRPRKEIQSSARNLPAQAYKHGWTGAREISWIAYSHHIPIPTLEAHAVDRYLRLGDMLGFAAGPPDFHVPIPAPSLARADELLRQHGIQGRKLLVLSPGTIWETKQWTPQGFADVAKHFAAAGWAVALVGSNGDNPVCADVATRCPKVVNLCGQTKLSELAALIRRADLCISNDSAPMHLAVAVDCPVVSIFGPTDPLWIGPYGRDQAVVRLNLPCSPCYLRLLSKCPHNHRCMRDLPAHDVIQRAEHVLGAKLTP